LTDLLIVGAGLTGLFAAALASKRGAKVTVIAEGRGALEVSHGCIDVFGSMLAADALPRMPRDHPYSLAGLEALESASEVLLRIADEGGNPYLGSLRQILKLPTGLGAIRPTSLAPRTMSVGDLSDESQVAIAGFATFRDFYAPLVADNLRQAGIRVSPVLELPLVDAPRHRDAYATDLARLFDDARFREEIARAWKPRLTSIRRLGLPAVLGFDHAGEALSDLQEKLGVRLFEIPTLPPSVPGLRLERLLRRAAVAAGTHLIEGAHAIGSVDGRTRGRRVGGAVADTAGGPRRYPAAAVLLATGGVLNGGLATRQDGRVQESVFDLPVASTSDRSQWTGSSLLGSQPYAEFGVLVDQDMRPLGVDGEPMFENLFAAGGLLAGADRGAEGSRQGIGLATACRAVEVALG
jgi:glycerol-3-phosphate dehydrogenase subunit B